MAGTLVVTVTLGIVAMMAWSLILQEQAAQSSAGGVGTVMTPVEWLRRAAIRAFTTLRAWAGTASTAGSKWARQLAVRAPARRRAPARDAALSARAAFVPVTARRRVRFRRALELTGDSPWTVPPAAPVESWVERPSRLVAALELLLVIVFVGAVIAVAMLGAGHAVARIVSGHFGG